MVSTEDGDSGRVYFGTYHGIQVAFKVCVWNGKNAFEPQVGIILHQSAAANWICPSFCVGTLRYLNTALEVTTMPRMRISLQRYFSPKRSAEEMFQGTEPRTEIVGQ